MHNLVNFFITVGENTKLQIGYLNLDFPPFTNDFNDFNNTVKLFLKNYLVLIRNFRVLKTKLFHNIDGDNFIKYHNQRGFSDNER